MLKLQCFGPPHAKSQLIGKDPDARKDWGQEGKGATEDEMVGWHHWLNGHEFEQAPGEPSPGQGSLACCSTRGCKESGTTWQLNNIKRCGCNHGQWKAFPFGEDWPQQGCEVGPDLFSSFVGSGEDKMFPEAGTWMICLAVCSFLEHVLPQMSHSGSLDYLQFFTLLTVLWEEIAQHGGPRFRFHILQFLCDLEKSISLCINFFIKWGNSILSGYLAELGWR